MNHVAPKRPGGEAGATPRRRDDVEALIALLSLDEQGTDPAGCRTAVTSRIPPATLEDYESARRRGLIPAAVATRGRVCWGCFHGLSGAATAEFRDSQAFVCCPHCERVLFNPDWTEGR
jgi:predicted  nucleic acid-binding Zn-ribbon protein